MARRPSHGAHDALRMIERVGSNESPQRQAAHLERCASRRGGAPIIHVNARERGSHWHLQVARFACAFRVLALGTSDARKTVMNLRALLGSIVASSCLAGCGGTTVSVSDAGESGDA